LLSPVAGDAVIVVCMYTFDLLSAELAAAVAAAAAVRRGRFEGRLTEVWYEIQKSE
jgi:hypothetical protein